MRRFVTFSKGLRILLMVSMVLALVVTMVGSAMAQAAPKLEVTPATVPATTTLVAKVTGFKPKEAVVVLLVGALAGEDIILTGGECDATGNWSSPAKRIPQVAEMATVPAGVKEGKYTVKATGTAGSTATAEITVTTAPTPTPKPTPKPAATPAAKPAATPVAAAKAAVPKTGAPIPITLIAMAGMGLGVIGFALRRRV